MKKTFKDYIYESNKQYDFRIKIAGDITPDVNKNMQALLERFGCSYFKKISETPIQDLPLDFPKLKNVNVHVFEVILNYPTTQWELHEYLAKNLGIIKNAMVVRRNGEPLEQYQHQDLSHDEPLLTDPTYKEAPNANFKDYYGDDFNANLIKELSKIVEKQRKERSSSSSVIPSVRKSI